MEPALRLVGNGDLISIFLFLFGLVHSSTSGGVYATIEKQSWGSGNILSVEFSSGFRIGIGQGVWPRNVQVILEKNYFRRLEGFIQASNARSAATQGGH